jgi:hypothetical protein
MVSTFRHQRYSNGPGVPEWVTDSEVVTPLNIDMLCGRGVPPRTVLDMNGSLHLDIVDNKEMSGKV